MSDAAKPPRHVELIERRRVFQGYFAVDRYRLRHATHADGPGAGELGPEITREIFERGHAVCVLPYDPRRDTVVLIEQFRPGPYAADDAEPWLVETVAGIVDAGETPEAVARREALEEAGIAVGRLEPMGLQYMSPGGSSESIRFYVGEVDSAGAGGVHGLDSEAEDIRVFTASFDEARAMATDGRIRNAMTAFAVLRAAECRETLRSRWARA